MSELGFVIDLYTEPTTVEVPEDGCIINLGGEGEIRTAINVNLPHILAPNWRTSRDGLLNLRDIHQSGPIIIARGDMLPFRDSCVRMVVCQNAPIGNHSTWLGPAYSPQEIERIKAK